MRYVELRMGGGRCEGEGNVCGEVEKNDELCEWLGRREWRIEHGVDN